MLVYVRGIFDLFHSGHATFLQRAHESARELAGCDDVRLFVHILSDRLCANNGRPVCIPQSERLFMVENCTFVWKARIIDDDHKAVLEGDMEIIRPATVYMNTSDDDEYDVITMRSMCKRLGIRLVTGERTQKAGIARRDVHGIQLLLSHKATSASKTFENGSTTPEQEREQSAQCPRREQEDLHVKVQSLQRPIVFVSGCFDLLHSGHVAFFNEAKSHGQSLYVSLGNDANLAQLKSGPAFPEAERLLLVESVKSVTMGNVCRGMGMTDFEHDLDVIKPDVFFVNEDGDRPHKRTLCASKGIQYIVSRRKPEAHLMPRSSSSLKKDLSKLIPETNGHHTNSEVVTKVTSQTPLQNETLNIHAANHGTQTPGNECVRLHDFPWRICLVGGWLDQPWVSQVIKDTYTQRIRTKANLSGCGVIVINIKANAAFKTRSSLATSSRRTALELWGGYDNLPKNQTREHLAKLLFGAENPPGCAYVSGSQDHLGLLLPGLSWLGYRGDYWPECIHNERDAETCAWLQSVLWLVPLDSRNRDYQPLAIQNLTVEAITKLADASAEAWRAIEDRDSVALGKAMKDTMHAHKCILPNTIPSPEIEEWTAPYADTTHGYICGHGGGFLFVVSDTPVVNGFQVEITTSEEC